MTTLSEAQQRDLRLIVFAGYSRGDSANTCESLCRLGLLRGDWVTGYYVTPKGQRVAREAGWTY